MSRPDASGAFEDLAARARTLSTQVQRGRYDRLLLIVGGLLLPLGLLLIVLAWLGASHTVLVFEQIPYLISGGLLGLGLVIVGGFVYFAYWQTLLVREGRDQARRVEGLLERIEAHLSEATTARFPAEANGPAAAGPRTPARASAGRGSGSAAIALATPSGTMLHRPDCQVVSGRDDLRRVALGTAGFEPCRICHPDLDRSPA